MQDRPRVGELLDAVRHFLETDVVPALQGHKQFHARVAVNVLAIIGRELEHEDTQRQAEWERLARLLDDDQTLPSERAAANRLVRQRTADLCARIERGDADSDPWGQQVVEHLRRTVIEKLVVANPKFLASAS